MHRIKLLALVAAALVSGFVRSPLGSRGLRVTASVRVTLADIDSEGRRSLGGNEHGNGTTPILPTEELYGRFYRLLQGDDGGDDDDASSNAKGTSPFDAEAACRDHGQLLFRLIGSDIQNFDAEENAMQMQQMNEDVKTFPESYVRALDFTRRVLRRLQGSHHLADLYSAAKFIPKKEGLLAIRTDPASLSSMTVRHIVESKRKIERSLSLLLTLLIAHTQARAQGNAAAASDLVHFSKILLERLPVHERHFSMLVLCRGILVPPPLPTRPPTKSSTIFGDGSLFSASPYSSTDASSNSAASRAARRLRIAVSQPPLGSSFASSMRAAGVDQPSATVRMIFPFAASALRHFHHAHRLDRSEEDVELDDDDDDEEEASVNPYSPSPPPADLRIARLAAAFAQIDHQSRQAKSLTGVADETIVTLRRWILDLCAGHFIATATATATHQQQAPDPAAARGSSAVGSGALPEHLRRNTVAMELVHTNQALAFGRQRHRLAWEAAWEEVGAHLDALCSLFDEQKAAEAGAIMDDGEEMEEMEKGEEVHGASDALTRVKKYLSCVSLLRHLPAGSKTRQWLELRSSSSSRGSSKGGRVGVGSGWGRVAADGREDDDLFGDRKTAEASKRGGATAADTADADLWSEPKRSRAPSSRQRDASAELHPNPFLHSLRPRVLLASADRSLATLVTEALSLPAQAIVDNPAASSELHYVFSTWRRPGLLLDYLHIHASSPPVQALHRRFLRALFSLSRETVDDIRFQDPGNRLHLSRLPPALAAAWTDGRSLQGGVNLPGYNDPQTLFMVGEDSSTCMMIRARQKGTNRGLLSFLLHGNVRVLGRKDNTGRLLERCVVVLAIDNTTRRPALLVETPFGEGERMEEVYDQCAELGDLLDLPVVYAKAPEADAYVMGDREIEAVGGKRRYVEEGGGRGARREAGQRGQAAPDGDVLFEDLGGDGEEEWGGDDAPYLALKAASPVPPEQLVDLVDYTRLAPWVWIDGIWDPARPGRYFPGRCPILTQRTAAPFVGIGVRPAGTIEDIPYVGPLCGEHAPSNAAASATDALFHSTLQRLSAKGAPTQPMPPPPSEPGSGKLRRPRESRVNANSMTAKLAERNRLLAERTLRPLRPPVPEGGEKKPAEEVDRFAGEKDPAFMPIFADDADDLFG